MTTTERFDAAYETIYANGSPINLSRTLETRQYGITVSVAAAEGIHLDDDKRPTSKGIGLLITKYLSNSNLGTAAKITNRVELYRDKDGEVIACYSGRSDVFQTFSQGLNHGQPDFEYEVPPQSREIALNSALIAIETALDQYNSVDFAA